MKLKSRSNTSSEGVLVKMLGMVPVMAPFCNRRPRREPSSRNSEFNVPVNPFESDKGNSSFHERLVHKAQSQFLFWEHAMDVPISIRVT